MWCDVLAERPYATQDAIKVMVSQLYQHNLDLNSVKDKSEHYAVGNVLVDRALKGINAAIIELRAMPEADFAEKWKSCIPPAQQLVGCCSISTSATHIAFLVSYAKHQEAVMLGHANTVCPSATGRPPAAEYQAALLDAAKSMRHSLCQLSSS